MSERFAMKLLCLILLFASAVAAQSALPRKDIPTIAKAANGAIVSIVMLDKDGHAIAKGTGFLISKDGHIVTNYHVIENGSSAIVKLPDGAFFDVDGVLASDKHRDVAVIKAHGENFRTLTLGNSEQLQVGEEVVAIGNPLSLESTVSNGIVSGLRTAEKEGGKFLQVTTPISPGSSGGPLFNMAGEVVGITTLYLEGGENLNFAIPINDAKRLLGAKFSKVQPLPNEPEQVQAQTHEGNAPSREAQALEFHLRGECAKLATKVEKDNPDYDSDDMVSWSSNYNAKYNRCYVLETSFNRRLGLRISFLFDGQTGETLASVGNKTKSLRESGIIYNSYDVPDCSLDSDCGYALVQKYINDRMQRDDQ